MTSARWVLVLPVKNAQRAKSRLAGVEGFGPDLARAIALDTIEAAVVCEAVARVVVVTDDDVVAASVPKAVEVVRDPHAAGPDAAIRLAMASIPDRMPRAALLADLPALRPGDLTDALAAGAGVDRGVVADAEGAGSTLVTARPGVPWASAFGADSYGRHVALGCVALPVADASTVRRDVDTPDHLDRAARAGLGSHTSAWMLRDAGAPGTSRVVSTARAGGAVSSPRT